MRVIQSAGIISLLHKEGDREKDSGRERDKGERGGDEGEKERERESAKFVGQQ